MKTTSVLFFILISSASYAQKKTAKQETSQKAIYATVERILYLQDQHYLAREIYTYALAWVYRGSGLDDRDALINAIATKLPALHEPGTKTATYDSIKTVVTLIAALAEKNVQQIQTFDDYYDSATDNLTEKAIEARHRIDEMSRQLQIVTATIQRQLAAEKQALNATPVSKSLPKGLISSANADLLSIEAITQAREINLGIYAGSINWIFRPQDAEAKASLMKNLTIPLALTDAKTAEPIATRVELNWIEELIMASRTACKDGVTIIRTEKDYEDPTQVFLAEYAIESEIAPRVKEIAHRCDSMLRIQINKSKETLADDQLRKEGDIRRMLRGQVLVQQYLVNNKNKFPDLKQDDLIELIVPIYAKRFSHKEIQTILQFQKSSAGKKMEQYATEMTLEILRAMNAHLEKIQSNKP